MQPNWIITRVWKFIMDVIAIGFIILCISSWIMWYKVRKKYFWGLLVLMSGFLIAIYFVFLLRFMWRPGCDSSVIIIRLLLKISHNVQVFKAENWVLRPNRCWYLHIAYISMSKPLEAILLFAACTACFPLFVL